MTSSEKRAIELLMSKDDITTNNWSFFSIMNALMPNSIYKPVPHSKKEQIDKIKEGVA